jgi:site-specific DNA recombinase
VFADAGISAANSDHRPDYERFREWLAAGRIAHVWTVEQTRLERREVEWFRLAAELDAAGINELHTNRDGIVRVRDEVAGIKAVLAAGEVRKMKKRVNDRLAENAANGSPAGGISYAHRRVVDENGNKTLEIIPERAEIVREAAERVLAGWGLNSIAKDLAERGVLGAQGGTISRRGLKWMLTSPSVAGHRVYQKRIVRRNCYPAVLDEATWQAVCAKLSQPRRVKRADGKPDVVINEKFFGRSGARKYLLTGGIAVCGVCRSPLAGTTRKIRKQDRVPYLECQRRLEGDGCVGIKMAPVDKFVVSELFTELDKPEFLDQLSADDHAARRDEIGEELTAAEGRRRKLAAAWAKSELTDGEWQTARQEITEYEQQLNAELAALPSPTVAVDIATAKAAWPDMTLEEQREFLMMFINHVAIVRGWGGGKGVNTSRIKIEWRKR